jgi:hypothetical protein
MVTPSDSQTIALNPSLSRKPVSAGRTRPRFRALRILLWLALGGTLLLTIPWKNVEMKRMTIDLSKAKRDLAELKKTQTQLAGEIEALASYPRISAWAEKKFHWKPSSTAPYQVVIPRQELSSAAQKSWAVLRVRDE